jgi:cyclase
LADLAKKIAAVINIPFTVGGGVASVEDVRVLLQNGADKIAVNSAAFKNPSLVASLAKEFGSQCIVVAIDTKQEADGEWYVYLNGGTVPTSTTCLSWAKQAASLGAGEILLTSMNHDGTKAGFALDITATIAKAVSIPVIASGGGGTMAHFEAVFKNGAADAALAASIFHFKEIEVPALKSFLLNKGLPIRL